MKIKIYVDLLEATKCNIYQTKHIFFFLSLSQTDQFSYEIWFRIHPNENDSYSESLMCCCGSRCSFDHVVGPWALFQSCPTAPSVAGSLENYDDHFQPLDDCGGHDYDDGFPMFFSELPHCPQRCRLVWELWWSCDRVQPLDDCGGHYFMMVCPCWEPFSELPHESCKVSSW